MTVRVLRRPQRLTGLGLVAVFIATACGSTVPLATTTQGSGTGSLSGDGLQSGLAGAQEGGTSESSVRGSSGDTAGLSGPTSTSGTTAASGSETAAAGAAGGRVPTGANGPGSSTRVVAPLKVGIITIDFGAALKTLGASSSATTDEDGFRALVRAFNDTGGIAGRRLMPTYVKIDAADSSYQEAGDRACATFQDAKVEVVLSQAASTYYGFAACLAKGGIPLISSNTSDKIGLSQAPWVFNAFRPTYDRGYGAVVDQLKASAYLTPRSTIGTIRITCVEVERAYKNTVLPRMKAHRLGAPLEYTVPCANGFSDAGSYSAAMQSAVLRFRSSGVDRVFIIGDQEALLLSYFAQQAESQGYRPGYALSSQSLPITLIGASTFPSEQLPQVHGVGWHPLGDAALDNKTAAEKRCTSLATKGGVPPKDTNVTYIVYQNCSNIFLLEAALQRGNGSANGPALRATIPSLGTSFASTGVLGGGTLFGPGRQDGPQLASEWGYVTSCSCFRYLGRPSVMH